MSIRDLLIKHEGVRNKPYVDTNGHETIGVGHNMIDPLPPDIQATLNATGRITDNQVNILLDLDIDRARTECAALYDNWTEIEETRQMAIMDWMFNVGPGTASTFVFTNACIHQGFWGKAAQAILDSKWAREVGQRAVEDAQLLKEGGVS